MIKTIVIAFIGLFTLGSILNAFDIRPPKDDRPPVYETDHIKDKPNVKIVRMVKHKSVVKRFDVQAAARTCKDMIRRSVKHRDTLTIHWDRQVAKRPGARQISYGFTSKNSFGVPIKHRMYCNFTMAGKLTKVFYE